ESVYDHPLLWGSNRIGPDLARIGGKYPHLWHVRHMEDPRSTSPASIMPPYPWLLEKELDAAVMPVRLAALRKLGVPYTETEVTSAESATLAQAKQIAEEIEAQGGPARLDRREITAMVAYLQRLGADLKKTPVSTP
ncbi:MAG: cbb3-type cytochrome c oxidase subunit II, partial [Rhodothermales bacterium]